MKSYNNHTNQGGYISWKGTGVFSNPVGITPGNIRPLTNNDPLNNSNVGFGLPRPIKHYRKGRAIGDNNGVVSSGGGSLIKQMIDIPGGYNIFPNTVNETSNTVNLNEHCNTCYGIGVISNWMPITNLTEKPETNTQTSTFCCNDEKKALRRTRPTNTKLKKKYYTTTSQYLYNRCKTYEQQQFNYITSGNSASKPGDPSSINNTYVGNCNPNLNIDNPVVDTDGSYNTLTNPQGCKLTQYKPNNYKFATQGAVSSSDRILRLNVDTINTNNANIHSLNLQKSKYFQGGCDGVSSIFYIPNRIISETTNSGTCSGLCRDPCPVISLSTIATTTDHINWVLIKDTTIVSCQTLLIPSGQTLEINSGVTLFNYGTITSYGTITNNGTFRTEIGGQINNYGSIENTTTEFKVFGTFTNYGNFTNTSLGTFNNDNTTGHVVNTSTGTITNVGTFYIKAGDTLDNYGTITNNGTFRTEIGGKINNYGSIENTTTEFKVFGTFTNYGNFTNTSTGIFNNEDTTTGNIINESTGTIINSGIFYIKSSDTLDNYGTITNNLTFRNRGTFTNYGTFNNNSLGTYNQASIETGTLNNKLSGVINNTGSFRIRSTDNNLGKIYISSSSGELILNTSGLINNGDIYISSSGELILNTSSSLTNNGNIYISSTPGNLTINTSSSLTNNGNIYVSYSGTLKISSSASLTNNGNIYKPPSSGSTCGTGTITINGTFIGTPAVSGCL
jgi:flagellar basal body rod protein FlgF